MNPGSPGTAGPGGLAASLRRLVSSALELAQLRLELLGTELEQQKLRIASALFWGVLALLLFGLTLVLLVALVLMLFWDSYRLQAASLLLLVFAAAGALALRLARARLQTLPGAFALSVDELKRDRDALAQGVGDTASGPNRQP